MMRECEKINELRKLATHLMSSPELQYALVCCWIDHDGGTRAREYVTVVPQEVAGSHRQLHLRWVPAPSAYIAREVEGCRYYSSDEIIEGEKGYSTWRAVDQPTDTIGANPTPAAGMNRLRRCASKVVRGRKTDLNEKEEHADGKDGIPSSSFVGVGKQYRRLFGSASAAVYVPVCEWKNSDSSFRLSRDTVLEALRSPHIHPMNVVNYLSKGADERYYPLYFQSLSALASAAGLFGSLPERK